MKTGDLKTQHDEINVLQPSGNSCGKIEGTRETGASNSFELGEGKVRRIEGKSAGTKYCRPFSHLQSEVPEQRAKLLFLNHLLCKSDHLFEFLAFILHLRNAFVIT